MYPKTLGYKLSVILYFFEKKNIDNFKNYWNFETKFGIYILYATFYQLGYSKNKNCILYISKIHFRDVPI